MKAWRIRLLQLGTICGFILIVLCQVHHAVTSPVWYDDAYNATVAKNLSLGYGYSTSYGSIRKFNPEITTGPSMILPAALLIKLFGNHSWVSHITAGMMTSALLIILLILLGNYFQDSLRRWVSRFILSLLLVFFTLLSRENYWFQLVGDNAAALFAAISILFLFQERKRYWISIVLSGLSLGLAYLTKTIIMLYIGPVIFFLVAWLLFVRKDVSGCKVGVCFILFMVSFVLFPALFEGYKRASTLPDEYRQIKVEERVFFAHSGSGITQWMDNSRKMEYMKGNILRNDRALAEFAGGPKYLLVLFLLLAFVLYFSRGLSSTHILAYAFLTCFAVHAAWWLLLSPHGWVRHVSPGLMELFVGLAILLAVMPFGKRWCVATLLLLMILIPKVSSMPRLIPTNWHRNNLLIALEETAAWLSENRQESVLMGAGWWANRDLEYVLPGVNNFTDYFQLSNQEGLHQTRWLVRGEFWNQEKNPELSTLEQQCNEHILFERHPFVVGQYDTTP